MNKLHILALSTLLCLSLSHVQAELNEFGLSNIMLNKNLSSDEENHIIRQRIAEELGENYTLQDVFTFISKIQAYYDHLLNTQTLNEQTILVAKLALRDLKKAKMSPTIKSNTVTPDDEHDLRIAIGKLNRQINPHN